MLQLLSSNANLHFGNSPMFNGLSLQADHLPMADEYLQALYDTMHKALSDYPRVMAFRVDPRIPSEISDRMTLEDHKRLIKRFTASLKAIIKHDRQQKRLSGWVPDTKVRYVWCREVGSNGKPHYHFFILLNRDAYHMLGRACSPNENLISRVSRAWYSALGVLWNPQEPWVHVPKNPTYWIDRDNADSFQEAFYRASYLCKADTKQYGIGLRAFGTSRN
ncbi:MULTISPECIES: inovirus Gp2 family protein [unclassified Halomonas]|uniref:inovirus Gp2 family protein n=1 Tax=unclassified Halomonas TaxID=2609666 RepID=UPI002076AD7C|nr:MULTISPECIES: inovirus Gp2 family protein [unclassified Halomonas]